MAECRYTRPETLEDAVASLIAAEGEAHVIAGGVALGILMNEKLVEPTWLIDISRLEALRGIEATDDGGLRIGAMTLHREIERSPPVAERCPMLSEMASEIACSRIKNRGTIGGNICLADPQGDPPAAVIALRATLRVSGPRGPRDVPATEFFTDLYTTAVGDDELLQEIRIPPPALNSGAAFGKFSARNAMDYGSTVSVAVRLSRDPSTGLIEDIGLGLGGVGETPVWPERTEAALRERLPDEETFAHMRKVLFAEIDPLGDDLYSADYKRHVASVIMKRTVLEAYGRAGAKSP
ncbi:MAG: xanthine dehydrogenase family protein subunit M [Kiloniellales bacterium]